MTFTMQIRARHPIKNKAEGRALVLAKPRSSRTWGKNYGLVRDEKGKPVACFSVNGRLWPPHEIRPGEWVGAFPADELDEIPGLEDDFMSSAMTLN